MALDQAAKYLQRVVPWDGSHFIGIHKKLPPNPGEKRGRLPGIPFTTVQKALNYINFKVAKGEGGDLYLALSSQKITSEGTSRKGKPYTAAHRHRDTAYGLKALFADLDVKDGAYSDTREALKALYQACDSIALPRPNVLVASGTGGVHPYWTFSEVLGVDDWQARADALSAGMKEQGIRFDSQCTVDAVRVLRIPETTNLKTDPPAPVRLLKCEADLSLDVIDQALLPYFGKQEAPSAPGVNDELSGGITSGKAALRDIETVAGNCAFVENTLATGGAAHTNPLWFLSLTLAHYCEAGDETGHRLSSGHAGYHPDETQQELERIRHDRETRSDLGWPKCATITRAGAVECAACPHKDEGKSPLSFGTPSAAPAPEGKPPMPPGYYQDNDGFVWKRGATSGSGDDQQPTLVFRYDIFDAWVSPNPWRLHFKFKTGVRIEDVTLTWEDAATEQALAKSLQTQGIVVADARKAKAFMASFLQQLQANKETVAEAQPFGWSKTEGKIDGFIYHGTKFTPGGNKRAARPDVQMARIYTPEGDPDYWLQLTKFINAQKRPALDAIIAASFAAPLVTFTGENGFTMGAWSPESGVGKSTALDLGTAVWGEPQRGKGGLDSTTNSTMNRIGALRNLPLMWDEIRGQEQEAKFAKMLFQLSTGMEKGRSRRDGSQAEQGKWETILIYAMNSSLVSMVNETNRTDLAANMRMFEFKVPRVEATEGDGHIVQHLASRIKGNYGHAGARYSQWLGENHEKIRTEVEGFQRKFASTLKQTGDERYWVALMVTIIMGAFYANKLGLTHFDVQGLKEFLVTEFTRMRKAKMEAPNDFSRTLNVVTTLSDYLRDKRAQNTLVTENIWTQRGKPRKDYVKIVYEVAADRMGALQVQVAQKSHMIRLSEVPLGEWLKLKGIHRQSMFDGMVKHLGARRLTAAYMGSGTRLSTGFPEAAWELSTAGTELEDHVQWEMEEVQ